MILPAGFNAPMTLQHLVMQLALSGHLCLVSQHLQSLLSEVLAAAFIAFMQSDISMPASAAIMVSCDPLGCAAAHADPIGASVSDRAIKIAKNARSGFRVQNPSKRYHIMKTLTGTSRLYYLYAACTATASNTLKSNNVHRKRPSSP